MNHELIDHYGLVITSLRISITQRCNLNCIYCHEEGEEANPEREISLDTTAKTDFEEIIMALPDFKNVSQYMVDINSLEKTLEPRAAFKLQTKLEKL